VQVASPGVGWPVAWKRWALVVIGTIHNIRNDTRLTVHYVSQGHQHRLS
jgi:hypothetical protein